MLKKPRSYSLAAFLILALLVITMAPSMAYPVNGSYGASGYGGCSYGQGCSISITSSGSLGISLTPTTSGACSTNSDNVSVLTDDANGYSLTIGNSSATTNALVSGSNTISSTSGTLSSPSTLGINKWGYRVDYTSSGNYATTSSFGSGPTSQVTNASYPISPTFAQTQLSASTDTIANDSGAADPAVTTPVWFGVCADTSIAAGTYSTTIVYSAIAN